MRIKRDKPGELAVPEAPNQVCSMDFMAEFGPREKRGGLPIDWLKMDNTIVRAQVIETELRPDEYPTVAMDTLLPGRAAAVVASSTIINRSLPRILRLAQGARIALAEAIRASAMPREFTRFAAICTFTTTEEQHQTANSERDGTLQCGSNPPVLTRRLPPEPQVFEFTCVYVPTTARWYCPYKRPAGGSVYRCHCGRNASPRFP